MSSSAFDRLLADAARAARTSSISSFCDVLADVFPDVLPNVVLDPDFLVWSGDVPPEVPHVPPPAVPAKRLPSQSPAEPQTLPAPKLRKKSGRSGAPSVHDVASRTAALEQWASILKDISGSCRMSLHIGAEPAAAELVPYFATRATGTLSLHASL